MPLNIIDIDVNNLEFCPGPCRSIQKESKPIILGRSRLWYEFKPHSGGRLNNFTYPIDENNLIELKNVRLCRDCYSRYLEYSVAKDYNSLLRDGKTVYKKIEKNK